MSPMDDCRPTAAGGIQTWLLAAVLTCGCGPPAAPTEREDDAATVVESSRSEADDVAALRQHITGPSGTQGVDDGHPDAEVSGEIDGQPYPAGWLAPDEDQ